VPTHGKFYIDHGALQVTQKPMIKICHANLLFDRSHTYANGGFAN